MKITIEKLNEHTHVKATNENGNSIDMDGTPAIGGQGLGMRPMEVLLASLGGCTSMDVISILQKQHQDITSYHLEVDGVRDPDKEPSLYKTIHLTFTVKGVNLDPHKVQRAVELSMEKYCSVAKTLEPTATLTYSIQS